MAIRKFDRQTIHRAIDELPDEQLKELGTFINYLYYQLAQQHGSPYLREMVQRFAHVQDAFEASGMSEDEMNQFIGEAIDEARQNQPEDV